MKILSIALAFLAIFLFSGAGLLGASATGTQHQPPGPPGTQPLSLTIMGGVVSAGNQHYLIDQHGQALLALVQGDPIAEAQLTYHLDVQIQGMSATGTGMFHLTGQDMITGSNVNMNGFVKIVSSQPAVCFTGTSMDLSCSGADTSQVPADFLGYASILVTTGQTPQTHVTLQNVLMAFESPYFNPFGNAIMFGDATTMTTNTPSANSILVVTNYSRATIDWSQVVDAGVVSGTLGAGVDSTTVSGYMTQVASEHEDLVAGTAQDSGTLTLQGMTPSLLDVSGPYNGHSIIPTAGSIPCGSVLGIQICTQTGFLDSGNFHLNSGPSAGHPPTLVKGSYSTTWLIPAFGFTATATATAHIVGP